MKNTNDHVFAKFRKEDEILYLHVPSDPLSVVRSLVSKWPIRIFGEDIPFMHSLPFFKVMKLSQDPFKDILEILFLLDHEKHKDLKNLLLDENSFIENIIDLIDEVDEHLVFNRLFYIEKENIFAFASDDYNYCPSGWDLKHIGYIVWDCSNKEDDYKDFTLEKKQVVIDNVIENLNSIGSMEVFYSYTENVFTNEHSEDNYFVGMVKAFSTIKDLGYEIIRED